MVSMSPRLRFIAVGVLFLCLWYVLFVITYPVSQHTTGGHQFNPLEPQGSADSQWTSSILPMLQFNQGVNDMEGDPRAAELERLRSAVARQMSQNLELESLLNEERSVKNALRKQLDALHATSGNSVQQGKNSPVPETPPPIPPKQPKMATLFPELQQQQQKQVSGEQQPPSKQSTLPVKEPVPDKVRRAQEADTGFDGVWPHEFKSGSGVVSQLTVDELTRRVYSPHHHDHMSAHRDPQHGGDRHGLHEVGRWSQLPLRHSLNPCLTLPPPSPVKPPSHLTASATGSSSPSPPTSSNVCEKASQAAVLAMTTPMKVTLMPKSGSGGVRAYALIEQGLELHPNIDLVSVDSIQQADYVVWLPGSTKEPPTKEACPPEKLIIVDFGDGFQSVRHANDPNNYAFYFKRSWVMRRNNKKGDVEMNRQVAIPHYAKQKAYFPIGYSLAEQFLLTGVTASAFTTSRTYPVICTLRPTNRGFDLRGDVLSWVREAAEKWKLTDAIVGEVDHGGRRSIQNKNYLEKMRHSRIVVTCNPAGWEGDSRTWEALASGALVMVDRLVTPVMHPLVDGVHVVTYDPTNRTDFDVKLKYYLDHPQEANHIGLQGYVYALRHHRTINRADYMFNVVTHYQQEDTSPTKTLRRLLQSYAAVTQAYTKNASAFSRLR